MGNKQHDANNTENTVSDVTDLNNTKRPYPNPFRMKPENTYLTSVGDRSAALNLFTVLFTKLPSSASRIILQGR